MSHRIDDQRSKSGAGESVASALCSLVIAVGATVKTETIKLAGVTKRIYVKCPDFATAVSVTLTLTDKDGYELYEKAAIAENTTTEVTDEVWLPLGDIEVKITANAAIEATPKTVEVKILVCP